MKSDPPYRSQSDTPMSTKGGIFETREPGFGQLKSTNLFRAVNFELYARPNKFVMTVGLAAFVSCIGYMFYMNLTDDKHNKNYNTINLDGTISAREKSSRWN